VTSREFKEVHRQLPAPRDCPVIESTRQSLGLWGGYDCPMPQCLEWNLERPPGSMIARRELTRSGHAVRKKRPSMFSRGDAKGDYSGLRLSVVCAKAWRKGAPDICRSPSQTSPNSGMRKIAPETESVPANSATMSVCAACPDYESGCGPAPDRYARQFI
jgi:hypothetical protein